MNNAERLSAQGVVQLPGAERSAGNSVGIARALAGPAGDEETLTALARFLEENANRKVVASSEFFFDRGPAQLRRLKEAVGRQSLMIGYLRAYPEWCPSLYYQQVRKGRHIGDIDAFLVKIRERVSFRPAIETWLDVFGADALRLRHLSNLKGDSVVADLAGVLGISMDEPVAANASPHWIEIEFLRAMHLCEPNPGQLQEPETRLLQAVKIVRQALRAIDTPGAVYLAPASAEALERDYRADAAWLNAVLGEPMPRPRSEAFPDRPFVPSLAAMPTSIRDVLRRKLKEAEPLAPLPYLRETLARVWDFWSTLEGQA